MNTPVKLPTFDELVSENTEFQKDNALMVLLNQNPPDVWFGAHPTAKSKNEQGQSVPARYMPIERVEWLLSRIFQKWWVEVRSTQLIANSVCVTVRLFVKNPATGEVEFQDGIGATPIQTDAGASATDWSKVKSAGVQMAAPSAETYAIKDAAEKFGKIFGKDINRKNQLAYEQLYKGGASVEFDDLRELYELKKESLTDEEITNFERILNTKETRSYAKMFKELQSK